MTTYQQILYVGSMVAFTGSLCAFGCLYVGPWLRRQGQWDAIDRINRD